MELLPLRCRREIGGLAMRPVLDHPDKGAGAPQADGPYKSRGARGSSREYRWNDRMGRLLQQKRGPNVVIVGVLSVALLLGLVGLALHFLWVVAIIVMALGLGFSLSNTRRDNIDIVNQRADGMSSRSPSENDDRDAASGTVHETSGATSAGSAFQQPN
jgi:hypothetical protein